MKSVKADPLTETIAELRLFFSDWRMGRLVGNLVTAAGGTDEGAVWEIEDEQLLVAARRLIERNRSRKAEPVGHGPS